MAKRYNITRDAQDEYALQSQQRTAAAQAGKFDDEIIPTTTNMGVMDRETKEISFRFYFRERSRKSTRPTSWKDLQA